MNFLKRRALKNRSVLMRAFTLLLVSTLGAMSVSLSAQALISLFDTPDPLAVDVAFTPAITRVDADSIAVTFTIADEYYLYKDKLEFSVSDVKAAGDKNTPRQLANLKNQQPLLSLQAPIFADALTISDEFFGEQAIFRQSTVIELPYSLTSPLAHSATLSIKFQGCADMGLCYPPTTTVLPIELPAGANDTQIRLSPPFQGNNPLADIFSSKNNAGELLPPEQAYLPRITAATGTAIDVKWIIEDGYYLYRDKISFSLSHPASPSIESSVLSAGTEQFDQFFGNTQVLRHSAQASIKLAAATSAGNKELARTEGILTISYQGCADIGVCFPPSQTALPILFTASQNVAADADSSVIASVTGNPDGNTTNNTPTVTASSATEQPAQSEQDRLASLLGSGTLWLTVATFFGLGLLLAFTPCVLPMIPILSSLIVGQGSSMSTGRAFQLSLVYVLVMASTYAAVGVMVGLSGYNVQAFLQHPYVLSGIAILFVLLSLSMFGFYELQMPTAIQNKLTQWSNKQGGGQIGGVAAMGFLSTLIVGPCVTAPLAGALIYIANTGDALIGGSALFALGLGMGAPLLLIGTSAGKLVPKAGPWMETTKQLFGILMLAMAIYMLSRFLPTTIIMAMYGILAVMSGVYVGATDTVSRQSSGWQRFGKGAGLVVALYGFALLVGALSGGNSYTTPLRSLTASTSSGTQLPGDKHALNFQRVKSVENLQSVVSQASSQGRPVMLDFYADWCISCKEMEAFTFTDNTVQELLASAIVVQADVTANDAQDQALLKQFNLFGPPGIIFYDAGGNELPAARVVGFMNAEKFSAHIRRFISGSDT